MKLSIPSFAGMMPRVGAKYLEPNFATYAQSLRTEGPTVPERPQVVATRRP